MIKNPDIASSLRDPPVFQIKDLLLGDAVERNKLTKPHRLLLPTLNEHPLSMPAEQKANSEFH